MKVAYDLFIFQDINELKIAWPVEMGTFHQSNFSGSSFGYFSVIKSRRLKICYRLILIYTTTKFGGYSLLGSCTMKL